MKNKRKEISKPRKEVKAFVSKETTLKKGETTNKRISSLDVKTKEL